MKNFATLLPPRVQTVTPSFTPSSPPGSMRNGISTQKSWPDPPT